METLVTTNKVVMAGEVRSRKLQMYCDPLESCKGNRIRTRGISLGKFSLIAQNS